MDRQTSTLMNGQRERERKRQNDGQPSVWTGRQRGNEIEKNIITDGWTNREGEGVKDFFMNGHTERKRQIDRQ